MKISHDWEYGSIWLIHCEKSFSSDEPLRKNKAVCFHHKSMQALANEKLKMVFSRRLLAISLWGDQNTTEIVRQRRSILKTQTSH